MEVTNPESEDARLVDDVPDVRQNDRNMDPEQNRLDFNILPSRDVSVFSSQNRLESVSADNSNPVSSLEAARKSDGIMEVNPSRSLIPGMVYSIPDGLNLEPAPDSKVLLRAQKLSLHPRQEHMRMDIARALVSHKPCSPKSKRKSGFLSRVFKRL